MTKRRHRRNTGQNSTPQSPPIQKVGKTCPSCKAAVSDTAKFCPTCGHSFNPASPIEIPQICVYCETPYEKDAKFCLECGESIPLPALKELEILSDEASALYHAKYEEKKKAGKKTREIWDKYDYDDIPLRIYEFDDPETQQIIYERAPRFAVLAARERTDYFDFKHVWAEWLYNKDFTSALDEAWQYEHLETDNPKAHEALFRYYGTIALIKEARKRRHIIPSQIIPHLILSPEMVKQLIEIDYDVKEGDQIPSPDYPEQPEPPKEDTRPLPTAKTKTIEFAGTVITFSDIEAVLVVYMDAKHRGRKVDIFGSIGKPFEEKWKVDDSKEIMERNVDGIPICAAIFPHIPIFTNDKDRRKRPDLKERIVQVTYSYLDPEAPIFKDESRWLTAVVTLRAGNVIELDWRGKGGYRRHDE